MVIMLIIPHSFCNTVAYTAHNAAENLFPMGITYLDDGTFMTCGYSVDSSNNERAYISKFGPSLSLITLVKMTNTKNEKCMAITSNGGSYAYFATAENSGDPYIYIYKVDSIGSIQWRLYISDVAAIPYDMIIGFQSKIIIIGDSAHGDPRFICSVSDNTVPTYSCEWHINKGNARGITLTANGNYAITGELYNSVHFHTYNPTTLNMVVFKNLPISSYTTIGLTITTHSNGVLIIAGYEEYNGYRAFILKASESAGLIHYKISLTISSRIFDVLSLNNEFIAYAAKYQSSEIEYSLISVLNSNLDFVWDTSNNCASFCDFRAMAKRPNGISLAAIGWNVDFTPKNFQYPVFIDLCLPGTFYDGSKCTSCSINSYQDSAGAISCKTCSSGNYMPDNTKCLPCEPGSYQPWGSQTSCSPCPTGQYQDLSGQAQCKICGIGNYQPSLDSCIPCSPGHYQNVAGQQICKPCDAGKYQDLSGKDFCNDCPVGYYSNSKAATKCIECSPGSVQPQIGKTSCNLCSPGRFEPCTRSTTCSQCPVGHYANDYGSIQCKKCLPNTYQDLKGETQCKPCGSGKYQPEAGQASCLGILG